MDNSNSSSNSTGKLTCAPQEYQSITAFLQHHHLDDLMPTIIGAKFGNYLWNILRLPAPAAREFYQTTLYELRVAKDQGLLKRSEFVPRYWLIAQMMLHAPKLAEKFLIH